MVDESTVCAFPLGKQKDETPYQCQASVLRFHETGSWVHQPLGRVENWQSSNRPISSSPSSNRTFNFLEYGFPVIFFHRLSQSPAWPSDIVSSEVPESFQEFPALSNLLSFLPFFGNVMKVLPLPSFKVLLSLKSYRYYGCNLAH